jgi:hypothetical protein
MAKIKGTSFLNLLEYFEKIKGLEGIEQVKAALSEKDRIALFSKPIMPISLVDYHANFNFLLTADKILGKGDLQLIKDAVAYEIRKNFTGIYKLFISFTSMELIINSSARAWRQYLDTGAVTIERKEKKIMLFKITDFPNIPLHHDVANSTAIITLASLSGAKNVTVNHVKCMARGDQYCLSEIKWE